MRFLFIIPLSVALFFAAKTASARDMLTREFIKAGKMGSDSFPFMSTIKRVEREHNLPDGLLYRLLYQESRFRPDIISGDTISSAGAEGIAQIVPRWHPDVNTLDPIESIEYAGQYLNRLFRQFGEWDLTLAAYNWGPGNVSKAAANNKPFSTWPQETQNYVTEITGDLINVPFNIA